MYANRVTKTPRITTNMGQPDQMVKITCDVMTKPDSTYPVVIQPYKVDLSQFGEKQRVEVKFVIKNVSAKKIKPTLIAFPKEYLAIKLPKQIDPGKSGEAIIRVTKDGEGKAFDKSITLQMDDEKASRFTVPIKRIIRSGSALPSAIPAEPPTGH